MNCRWKYSNELKSGGEYVSRYAGYQRTQRFAFRCIRTEYTWLWIFCSDSDTIMVVSRILIRSIRDDIGGAERKVTTISDHVNAALCENDVATHSRYSPFGEWKDMIVQTQS